MAILFGISVVPSLCGQGASAPIRDWERAAGGAMSFEVASIREDPSGKFYVPVPTDSDDDFVPTGGSFTASMPLKSYIAFAYKLSQQHSMLSHLPSWASSKSFELHAKAAGNPTKDQYRLMVQSLLAERFKLAIRFETQDTPVLVMTLARAGKMGPGLRLHADGPACDVIKPRVPGSAGSFDMFPCGVYLALNQPDHSILAGARNTTVELMAAFITNIGHERAIVDRTGIIGKIDFSMEYMPEVRGVEPQPEMPGTTFLGAVKDQLGLRLEPSKVPLEIPVVDHVELPSEN